MREWLMVRKRVVKHRDARWYRGAARTSLRLSALTLALMFAVTSSALASPKGIFARFAQCPTGRPGVALCQHAEVTGGTVTIGKISIPITRPIVIQDGAVPTGGANVNEYFLSPAANGESVSSNELQIPGGPAHPPHPQPGGCYRRTGRGIDTPCTPAAAQLAAWQRLLPRLRSAPH